MEQVKAHEADREVYRNHAPCDCCGLLALRTELLPWTRRALCRELAVLDPALRKNRRPDQEWVSGMFRYFYVTHAYRICPACFDHMLDGGRIDSLLRHRPKIALVVLATVVVALIVLLPAILPVLKSALWRDMGES